MDTSTRHLLAAVLLISATLGSIVLACLWQKARDAALAFLVFGSVLMEKMDVTYFGQFWYRGTSRGVQFSLVDIAPLALLIATLLFPRYRGRFYWPASFGMMLLFFVYCCASVWNADRYLYGVWELAKMARGLMVFLAAALFIRSRREVAIVVAALSATVIFETINGIEQHLFKGASRIPGTLDHENTLSTYLCMVSPVLLAAAMSQWPKWLRIFSGVAWLASALAELMTLSRMGVPVFGLVNVCTALGATSWKPTKEKAVITALVLLGISGFVAVTWDGLKSRYLGGDIRAELTDEKAFETRGVYWRTAQAMVEDHPYGIGLNTWSYAVGKTYGPAFGYPYHDYDELTTEPTREEAPKILLPPAADSLPALLLGELGYAGFALMVLVFLRWIQMGAVFLGNRLNPDPLHRLGIGLMFGALGIFLQSSTEWTYKQPPVLFTCHTLMGMLASLFWLRKHRKKAAADEEVVDGELVDDENFVRSPLPQPGVR